MKTLSLLLSLILSFNLGLSFSSFAQTLDNNPLGICQSPPPGCQEEPICTYYDDCFRFDFYAPRDLGNGTSVIKHKITNFSESTFKQATFELPGDGASTPPAVSPTSMFRNRYNHSVINKFNDSLIAFNAINAGTFSYGGFEVYYYIVQNSQLSTHRSIAVTAKAGRPWQQQRTGSVIINIDDCISPCPPPTATIFRFPPGDLCLFNDDPYIFEATPQTNNPTYTWTVRNGSIISGQGTPIIAVVPDSAEGELRVILAVRNDCNVAIASKLFNVIDCGPINPLPVSLTSFKGKPGSEGIVLTWTTASEKNNARFEIERSSDARNFEKIGTVEGHGNSNTLLTYSYLDARAEQGQNLYRLKQVDFDGKYEYSHIIAVRLDESSKMFAVQLLPNPCTDHQCAVQLRATDQINPVNIEIQDLAGRIVYSKQLSADQTSFQLPKLSSGGGIYILTARNGKHTAYQKVLLQ